MVFRSLTTHPVFLPLAAIFAVMVTIVTLQASVAATRATERAATAAQPAPRTAVSTVPLHGQLVAVELARDAGLRDAVVVRITQAGTSRDVRLFLSPDTRIVAPYGDRHVVGGPEDLATGQDVMFALADDMPMRDRATIARLRIVGGAQVSEDAA